MPNNYEKKGEQTRMINKDYFRNNKPICKVLAKTGAYPSVIKNTIRLLSIIVLGGGGYIRATSR